MAFEIAAALFGLAGTGVGGGVTLAANRLSARNQRKLAENARQQTIEDRQYNAHQELLIRTDRFMESLRTLIGLLNGRAARDVVDQSFMSYKKAWDKIYDAKAPAELAGPAELKEQLAEMFNAVVEASRYVDDWYDAQVANRSSARGEEAERLRVTFYNKRTQYLNSAERVLSSTPKSAGPEISG